MNIVFWSLLIVMLLLAIAILAWPLLRINKTAAIAYRQSNLELNRQKVEELDIDLKEGRIDEAMYRSAREELDRELLADIPEESVDNAAQHYTSAAQRQPAAAIMIAIAIPAIAFLTYLELGMHSASDDGFAQQQASAAQAPQQQMSIAEMADLLSDRLSQNGGTVEEWTMLGRAHKHLGEFELAEKAFDVALKDDPLSASLMLEKAEVMAIQNERVFAGESYELVMRAYQLQPSDPNSLWFAGVAEYQAGNYQQAIDRLVELLPMAIGEEEVMRSLVAIVAQSREALIAQGENVPEMEDLLGIRELMQQRAAMQVATQESTTQASASPVQQTPVTAVNTSNSEAGRQIAVNVDVADSVRQGFAANDTVFVYARARQGPPMPLAVQRLTLSGLPATVILDDSMAMVQGMNLSAFPELVVSARISKSGNAIAQAGDYIGSAQQPAGNGEVTIMIDQAVE